MKSLIPKFLRKIDSWLLLNQPRIWSTQIHYAIYSGLIISPFFFIAGFFAPFLVRIDIFVIYILALVGGLVILMFSWYWIMRSLVFSIEGNFGFTRPWWSLIEVPLYNLCIACLLLPVMIYLFYAQFRIESMFNNNDISIQRDLSVLNREIDATSLSDNSCAQPVREVIERYGFYDSKKTCLSNSYSSQYKIERIVDFLTENNTHKLLITYLLLTNLGLLIFLGKQGNRYRAEFRPMVPLVGIYSAMFVIFAIWTNISITSFTLSIFGGKDILLSRPILIILMLIAVLALAVWSLRQSGFVFFLPILFAVSIYLLLELAFPDINQMVQIVMACIAYMPLLPYTKKSMLHNSAMPRR